MKIIQCSSCRRPLEPEAFQRNKRGQFGRHHRCRACEKLRDRERSLSGKRAQASRLWRIRNPERAAAHSAVAAAIRRGELMRQACEVCGDLRAEAHHADYREPLRVQWLCRQHHAEEHRQQRFYGIGQVLFLSLLEEARE